MEESKAPVLLLENAARLYAAAYAKTGGEPEAILALQKAVKKAAPMYEKLSNKEQFIPLILKNIGGAEAAEPVAPAESPEGLENLLCAAYEEGIKAARKKKRIILLSVMGGLLLAGLVGVLCYIFRPEPPHVHQYEKEVIAPTCTEEGYTLYRCACGEKYKSDIVSPAGHTFGEWQTVKQATTEAEGEEKRVCSVCKAEETRTTPKAASDHTHMYVIEEITKQSTCTAEGVVRKYCVNHALGTCDAYVEEAIPKAEHSWGEWTTTKEATDTEPGERKHVCKVCGTEATEAIPAKSSGLIVLPGSKSETHGNITLSNIHNVSEEIGLGQIQISPNEDVVKMATAPDGTVYLTSVIKQDKEKLVFTAALFKMTSNGWEKVCEITHPYEKRKIELPHGGELALDDIYPTYMFFNSASEPYLFIPRGADERLPLRRKEQKHRKNSGNSR